MNAPQDKKSVVKELLELGKQKGQLTNQDILDAIGEIASELKSDATLVSGSYPLFILLSTYS